MGLADLGKYSSSVRIDGRGRFLAVRAELNEETIMSFRNERFMQKFLSPWRTRGQALVISLGERAGKSSCPRLGGKECLSPVTLTASPRRHVIQINHRANSIPNFRRNRPTGKAHKCICHGVRPHGRYAPRRKVTPSPCDLCRVLYHFPDIRHYAPCRRKYTSSSPPLISLIGQIVLAKPIVLA